MNTQENKAKKLIYIVAGIVVVLAAFYGLIFNRVWMLVFIPILLILAWIMS